MKYVSATAFQQALTDHLRRESGGSNPRHQWLRQLVAFERLLARMAACAPDVWVLKGGLALELRLGGRARTTRDIDLALKETQAAAEAAFRRIESHTPDD